MITQQKTSAIFLNRVKYKGKLYIKLYYKPNDIILKLIKNNDWIRYSIMFSAYYIIDT